MLSYPLYDNDEEREKQIMVSNAELDDMIAEEPKMFILRTVTS